MFALARRLVRDDAEADDVVQTTWLTAMERGPRDAQALPAWLASVVRNAARQLARSESRRRAREGRVALPYDASVADDPVQKAESQRLVVGAVLELAEPYRTTVLLRYYEDLPPREIAERMECPVNTVRARLRRALGMLRSHLEERDGASWRTGLMPLCVGSVPGAGAARPGSSSLWTWSSTLIPAACLLAGWVVGGGLELPLGNPAPAAALAVAPEAVDHAGIERVQARIERLQRRRDALRRELAGGPSTLEPSASTSEPAPTADVEAPADVSPGAFDAFFDPISALEPLPLRVDWESRGSDALRYLRLARRLVELLDAGEEPAPALVGELQVANGPLAALALELHAAGVDGSGANSSFTAPEVQVRLAASALAAAELPLDDAQLARLVRGLPAPAATGSEPGLATWVLEAGPRRRTLELLRSTLTEEQLAIVLPGGGHGLGGIDLFGEGLLWSGRGLPVTGGRDAFRDALLAEHEERYRDTFDRWWQELATGADADLLAWSSRRATVGGSDGLTRWAEHILSLARALPPSDARERLLTLPHLPIPLETSREDTR